MIYFFPVVKGIVDGINGTDKQLLMKYSARELAAAQKKMRTQKMKKSLLGTVLMRKENNFH